MSSQASVMPASNGFTIVILKKLEQAIEEQFLIPYEKYISDTNNNASRS